MVVLRTPDSAFANLADFPFAPHYLQVSPAGAPAVRVHYVDEGPRDARTVLMLHGEPSWSFLYRHTIAACATANIRAVAPDLIGFGRSDKPANGNDYTYQRHVDWIGTFIRRLDLRQLVLLCHDWGGLIGLRVVAEHPHRFAGVIAMNTDLPTGDREPSQALVDWQELAAHDSGFAPGRIISGACVMPLRPEEVAAYNAPFPEEIYKAGARRFPRLVPTSLEDPASAPNRRAWSSLATFAKPFLTVFGRLDPYTVGAQHAFRRKIPGAAGRPHVTIANAGHFLPEDASAALADIVTAFAQELGDPR